MAVLKNKDIQKMSKKEIEEKIDDLKMEIIKSSASAKGKLKPKEIKKAIARMLTINRIKSIESFGKTKLSKKDFDAISSGKSNKSKSSIEGNKEK
jgi:ribosomal protein L29